MMKEVKNTIDFRKLPVWKKSLALVDLVYDLQPALPGELRNQINRAVTSVYLNISESSAYDTAKAICRYLKFAQGSAFETKAVLILAEKRKYVSAAEVKQPIKLIDEIDRLLTSMQKTLLLEEETT